MQLPIYNIRASFRRQMSMKTTPPCLPHAAHTKHISHFHIHVRFDCPSISLHGSYTSRDVKGREGAKKKKENLLACMPLKSSNRKPAWPTRWEFLIMPAHKPLFLFADLKSALFEYVYGDVKGDAMVGRLQRWLMSHYIYFPML